jgi:hypothetical protein
MHYLLVPPLASKENDGVDDPTDLFDVRESINKSSGCILEKFISVLLECSLIIGNDVHILSSAPEVAIYIVFLIGANIPDQ